MSNEIYIAYHFSVKPLEPAREILVAELGMNGFESFVDTKNGVTAYIQKKDWREDILEEIHILNSDEFVFEYEVEDIKPTNWNAEWEKNFNPIIVDDIVTVRAPFHEKPNTKFDIIIEPKMSFGTGHHETTFMMIQHILKNDFKEKSVLDMGCGTAVLAILAEKRGAKYLDAIDIDTWCYENSLENIERNNCHRINVYKGDSELIKNKTYDIILANINRNVLIKDIEIYAKCLNPNGQLFLSGFYKEDITMIENTCQTNLLKLEDSFEKNNWVALKFIN